MRIPKSIFVPLAVSLFVVGAFAFPHTTFAEDVCGPGETQDQCQEVRTTVLEQVGNPTVTVADGLTPCDQLPSTFSGNCGMPRAASAGSNSADSTITWQQGDMVKCAVSFSGGLDTYCVITHNPGTPSAQTRYLDVGPAHTDAVTGNANGTGPVTGSLGASNGALGTILDCSSEGIPSCMLKVVATAIIGFANLFLGIAGVLLNLVVVRTIFQFGSIIGNSPGVLIAWGILRDIANMALLFGFIFMGIATILNTNGLHNYTATIALPRLLIFAILMNFSLFACEAVIDTSNAISSVMYAQANTTDTNCTGITGTSGTTADGGCNNTAGGDLNYGIAGRIMSSTGLSSIWNVGNGGGLGNQAVTLLGLAVFATVGAIVLFAASIMLCIRLVVLTFLMIVSPIGFAGMALPPLQNFANDWWKRVIHQAFYAPILLLLIFISLKVSDTFSAVAGSNGGLQSGLGAAVNSPSATSIDIILVFALVIGFLVGSIMIANKFGAMGAGFAVSSARKLVLGTFGVTAGFTGRNSLGRGGAWAQRKYETMAGGTGIVGKALQYNFLGMDSLANASIGAVKDSKYGGSRTFAEAQKAHAERTSKYTRTRELAELQTRLKAAVDNNDEDKVASILQQMSTGEIEQTKYAKQGADGIAILARNLSTEKFEEMMKNKDLGSDVKERLAENRFAPLAEAIRTGDQAEIQKWSGKDLELLAKHRPEQFNALITARNASGDSMISNDQFEALQKSNMLSNVQKRDVKGQSKAGRIVSLISGSNGNPPTPQEIQGAQRLIRSMGGGKAVAKLPGFVLIHPDISSELTVPQLQAIMTEDKLSVAQQRTLAAAVHARANEPAIANFINPAINGLAASYYTP